MRKFIVTILGVCGVLVFATPTLAATSVSFTPVSVNVSQGQNFTLTIGVNPAGVKNYTAKAELQYPANLLEVTSFTFANGWMPLAQPGYDLVDNTNGVLVKTAGYPGGLSSAITFGTVSFHAKRSGNGTIALNSDSFALDAENQDVLAEAAVQTAVAIAAPAQTTPATETPVSKPAETTEPAVTETATTSEEIPVTEEPITVPAQSVLAQVAMFIALGTDNIFVGILVIVAIVFLGYATYAAIRRGKRKKAASTKEDEK